ncbi:MAG TPA: cobalamin B12-binding domain-containing protein [Thermoanaerobaculia bacterium]|jgi:DNA-binding transcriptional MerR regulator/methylmalonyl-CoA mutase cobalamin-binding subunit|nr:cobalamin B12-binding domain-containing protein [Thermoanaerobaculia bacterium]
MDEPPETLRHHPIGVAARRTGLKPDLIRAWERRYGAVEPGRTETRRRFYSDADIERLLLLRRVVGTGRGIGQVGGLSNAALQALMEDESGGTAGTAKAAGALPAVTADGAEPFLALCLSATQRLDGRDLQLQLDRASVALSRVHLLQKLLAPLMNRVGELWHRGELRPSHEHMASAVVRSFLGGMREAGHLPATAPHLVVTTPARQVHELGALIVAATAATEGWQATYLGPDLPPEEIAAAAVQKGARAVAVSIVYPPDDPLLGDDLRKLRRLLPPGTELLIGGRAAASYATVIEDIGALHLDSLSRLREELELMRSLPLSNPGQ